MEKMSLKDEIFKKEEENEKITSELISLERDYQLARDEVDLRKSIVDSMGENLIKHESESMQMAQKLTLMKNEIMEYDKYVGMNRKYGAVRQGSSRLYACTVSKFIFNFLISYLFVFWYLLYLLLLS